MQTLRTGWTIGSLLLCISPSSVAAPFLGQARPNGRSHCTRQKLSTWRSAFLSKKSFTCGRC
ncbi:hypothetical protein PF005_g29012 [Phytophthora fragariae]|uniref:RxLR effector protein n=2 Tax=Phytophthora TaxID=4783 RepID=A0A6A3QAY2_9STRA|nr:hypothetical protein PF003_g20361 [Phytophthora fragariae]KAE8973672.1 hypothetical protein PR001_g26240 [Phytophthora rubi]KAE8920221.1 hypothetical protein PF009_g29482 [Phytophthora fragariae]KAE8977695.1 hypothetical protein PR002_g24934 [Phytophthora rubi]KAE9058323.1 hypothetical protein PF006_g32179 [Phytophthora fragariae]